MRATPHVLDPESVRGRRSRRAGPSTHPPAWQGDDRAQIVRLRVDSVAHDSAVRAGAGDLWAAWQSLDDWEAMADDELGARLGEVLLVLWTIHRIGTSPEGRAALDDLIDENLHPRFDDPLLEDVVGVCFALGAAWADRRGRADGNDAEAGNKQQNNGGVPRPPRVR
jgi:hypothetical protein